jgi:ABC-type Mn2+/Zn2+ transport system permease subunit
MHALVGLAALVLGCFMIWRRRHMAEESALFNNRRLAALRSTRPYSEREYRQNLRAAWIVGVLSIVLGVYLLVSG